MKILRHEISQSSRNTMNYFSTKIQKLAQKMQPVKDTFWIEKSFLETNTVEVLAHHCVSQFQNKSDHNSGCKQNFYILQKLGETTDHRLLISAI